jgi:hypothetical protein
VQELGVLSNCHVNVVQMEETAEDVITLSEIGMKMKDINVHFVTDADRPEPGIKSVKLVGLDIHPVTHKPMAAVQSPFFPGDVLVAEFKNNEWICYLDI